MQRIVAKNRFPGLVLAMAACLFVGALLAVGAAKIPPDSLFGTQSETRNTQVINSITREEQVVLLSLGIQGISEINEKSQFLGMDIPGSGKAIFVQYAFNAKLGIEGKDVQITKTGEDAYVVAIPEFIFIGHSVETFRLAAEKKGVLSWGTPEIDSFEAVNNILSDKAQDEYLMTNKDTLKDQARTFYTSIFNSIDPEISVRFEFPAEPR